MRPYLLE